MTSYKWTGVGIVLCFAAAFYGAVEHDTSDLWIVAALTGAVLWAAYGLIKTLN